MPVTPTVGLSVIIHLIVIVFRLISRRINTNKIKKKPQVIISKYLGSAIILSISVVILSGGLKIIKLALNDKHSSIIIVEKYVTAMADFVTAPAAENNFKQEIISAVQVFNQLPVEASNNVDIINNVLTNNNKLPDSSVLVIASRSDCQNQLNIFVAENKQLEIKNFSEINLYKYFVPHEKIYTELDIFTQVNEFQSKELIKVSVIKDNKPPIYNRLLCQL